MFQTGDDQDSATRVRSFYEGEGWQWTDGLSGDARRWGPGVLGPIRTELERHRIEQVRRLLGLEVSSADATETSLLELGSGGQPAVSILEGVANYTALDFSRQGLKAAAAALDSLPIASRFVEADARTLPLRDAQFDAVFSAHMIYHLPTAQDQEMALREMARVLRPGGILAVVTIKPYPWLFPIRCLRRVIAQLPLIGSAANRLRKQPPLPFRPMPLRWMCNILNDTGATTLHPHGIATTSLSQRLTEHRWFGRVIWKCISHVEMYWPRVAQHVGTYTLVLLRKAPTT
jgi:SAM-dependent methyltransferase